MDWFATDLMVGLEEGFGDQTPDVRATSGVENPTAFAPGDDQSREPQLGKVLARRRRRDTRQVSQSCDV